MTYCSSCGTEIADSTSFCPECGHSLNDVGGTNDNQGKAPCEQCGCEVNIEAIRCPECGYSPVDEGKIGRKLFMIGGAILTATLVGAIAGIPMIVLSMYVGRKKKQKGATGIASSS